ncbi:hypothetical protein Tco_0994113 [Tanacetum coccineum]
MDGEEGKGLNAGVNLGRQNVPIILLSNQALKLLAENTPVHIHWERCKHIDTIDSSISFQVNIEVRELCRVTEENLRYKLAVHVQEFLESILRLISSLEQI